MITPYLEENQTMSLYSIAWRTVWTKALRLMHFYRILLHSYSLNIYKHMEQNIKKCNNCWIKIWSLFEENHHSPSNCNGRKNSGLKIWQSLFNTEWWRKNLVFLGQRLKKLQCTVIEFSILVCVLLNVRCVCEGTFLFSMSTRLLPY